MRFTDAYGRRHTFHHGDRVRYNFGDGKVPEWAATEFPACGQCNGESTPITGHVVGEGRVNGERVVLWTQDNERHRIVHYDEPHLLDRLGGGA